MRPVGEIRDRGLPSTRLDSQPLLLGGCSGFFSYPRRSTLIGERSGSKALRSDRVPRSHQMALHLQNSWAREWYTHVQYPALDT